MSRKYKHNRRLIFWRHQMARPLLTLTTAFLIGGLLSAPFAGADSIQQQIDSLNAQNTQNQSNLSTLQLQATSYQNAIQQLQTQINSLQQAIDANQAKQAELQNQINAAQAELNQEKQTLGADIKAMYVDGQMTTIEELATSKSLSAFVDAETYRNAVESEIQTTLDKITALQNQLKDQKNQVDQLLALQTQQESQIASSQQQENQLLSYSQSQQASYSQQISSNNAKIAALVAEQIAANRKLEGSGTINYSGTCGGSYPASATGGTPGPWGCDYAHSSDYVPGCTYEDSWGMCNRECVSYTAWMVYKTYGVSVAGFGNANQWPSSAASAGFPTGNTPQVNSVAIYMGGSYGHAMWVKSVNSDGTITVDQYNLYYDGNFYETTIPAAGLTYIYF